MVENEEAIEKDLDLYKLQYEAGLLKHGSTPESDKQENSSSESKSEENTTSKEENKTEIVKEDVEKSENTEKLKNETASPPNENNKQLDQPLSTEETNNKNINISNKEDEKESEELEKRKAQKAKRQEEVSRYRGPTLNEDEFIDKKRQLATQLFEIHKKEFDHQAFDFCWKQTLEVYRSGYIMTTVHSPGIRKGRRQLVNHFPSINCLTTKTGLLKSLEAYYKSRGEKVFLNTPETFYIKKAKYINQNNDEITEWNLFVNRYKELENHNYSRELLPAKFCERNIWIVKPTGLNCGRGIMVFNEIDAIKKFIFSCGKGTEFVIQKYIEKPLLLWGRKFDIRIWCVVTDRFDVYLYHEGYLRTSSELFTLDIDNEADEEKQMVHLTNYCMQVKSENIGKFEEGNTLSFDQFQEYINEYYPDKHVDVFKDMVPRMKDLVLDSLYANENELNRGNKGRNCFELYGYDFMVDEDFRIWIIEVNTNPFLGVQNPWHQSLLDHMADDLVEIAIDPYYPKPQGYEDYHKELPNNWELLHTYDPAKKPFCYNRYNMSRDIHWLYPSFIPEDCDKKALKEIMKKPPVNGIPSSSSSSNNNNNNNSSFNNNNMNLNLNNNNNNNVNNNLKNQNANILYHQMKEFNMPIDIASNTLDGNNNNNTLLKTFKKDNNNRKNMKNGNNNNNNNTNTPKQLLIESSTYRKLGSKKKWLSGEPETPKSRCNWWVNQLKEINISQYQSSIVAQQRKKAAYNSSPTPSPPVIIPPPEPPRLILPDINEPCNAGAISPNSIRVNSSGSNNSSSSIGGGGGIINNNYEDEEVIKTPSSTTLLTTTTNEINSPSKPLSSSTTATTTTNTTTTATIVTLNGNNNNNNSNGLENDGFTIEDKTRHCLEVLENICCHSKLWLYAAKNDACNVLYETLSQSNSIIILPVKTKRLCINALDSLLKMITSDFKIRNDFPLINIDRVIDYLINNIKNFHLKDYKLPGESSSDGIIDSEQMKQIRVITIRLLNIYTSLQKSKKTNISNELNTFIIPFYLLLIGSGSGLEKDLCSEGLKNNITLNQLKEFNDMLIHNSVESININNIFKDDCVISLISSKCIEEIERRSNGRVRNIKSEESNNKKVINSLTTTTTNTTAMNNNNNNNNNNSNTNTTMSFSSSMKKNKTSKQSYNNNNNNNNGLFTLTFSNNPSSNSNNFTSTIPPIKKPTMADELRSKVIKERTKLVGKTKKKQSKSYSKSSMKDKTMTKPGSSNDSSIGSVVVLTAKNRPGREIVEMSEEKLNNYKETINSGSNSSDVVIVDDISGSGSGDIEKYDTSIKFSPILTPRSNENVINNNLSSSPLKK